MSKWLLFFIVLVLTVPACAEDLSVPAQVVRVYDGDTFTVDARPWPGVTVRASDRIDGIDTPEIRGKCEEEKRLAVEAREQLKALLGGIDAIVTLENPSHGKYAGRVVARVTTADGQDVSEAMIRSGHARPYDGGTRQGWCDQ